MFGCISLVSVVRTAREALEVKNADWKQHSQCHASRCPYLDTESPEIKLVPDLPILD